MRTVQENTELFPGYIEDKTQTEKQFVFFF